MTTLANLTAEYNRRAAAAGMKPIGRFGGSKSQLEKRIDALPAVSGKPAKSAAKKTKPAKAAGVTKA